MTYAFRMIETLSLDDVRKVAVLARLAIPDEELAAHRRDLASVLEHVSRLNRLDLDDVEPMAGPRDEVNRLDVDEPVKPMPLEKLSANAPQMMDRFIAVPKVIDE